jgi:hypothetical protein
VNNNLEWIKKKDVVFWPEIALKTGHFPRSEKIFLVEGRTKILARRFGKFAVCYLSI